MKTLTTLFITIVFAVTPGIAQQPFYDVTAGNGNGIRFWQDNTYKIHMGNSSEYLFGPVSDYSIKMNMSSDPGRGWTWGIAGQTPVAALNNAGDMQIAGKFTANGNINMAGASGRRLFMGGVSGSTFGIAFDAANPNFGIFYTEGSNDYVSISPNGNANNGIVNIFGDGKVGIGTNAPSNIQGWDRVLDVSSGGGSNAKIIATASNATYRAGIYAHASWNGGGGYVGTETNHKFHIIANYDPKMTVDVNGYVGIGTTAPRGKFDVDGPGDIFLTDDINTGSSQSLFLPGHIYLSPYGGSNISYLQARRYNDSGTTSLRFRTSNNGALTEAMHIEGNGNVGIGTTTPYSQTRLHVKSPTVSPWGLLVEANGNDRIIGVGHDGTNGFISTSYLGSAGYSGLELRTQNVSRISINSDGNVGIGTTSPTQKLTVNGTIYGKEVKVNLSVPGPDYVFEKDYKLPSLEEVKKYIDEYKRLPEVPAAKEMEANGIILGEMNMILLKKIEELTLYVIEQNERLKKQEELNEQLRNEIKQLKNDK